MVVVCVWTVVRPAVHLPGLVLVGCSLLLLLLLLHVCLSAAAAARLKQRFVCLEAHLLAQKTLKTECTDDVC